MHAQLPSNSSFSYFPQEKRKREEEEQKKRKERQEFLELIYVFVAFGIIISLAVLAVLLDNLLFPETHIITFQPLEQEVHSTIKYTGLGKMLSNTLLFVLFISGLASLQKFQSQSI